MDHVSSPDTTGAHTTSTHPAVGRRSRRRGLAAIALTGLGAASLGAVGLPTIASGSARNASGAGAASIAMQRPFLAAMDGSQEVPALGDPDGTGGAAVTIDPSTGQVCADLRVADIVAPTAAHIHRGGIGVAGPVEVTLTAPSPTSAVCVNVTTSLAAEIAASPANFYVNVHNTEYPGGAIRGQLATGTTSSGSLQLLPEPLRAYDSRDPGREGPLLVGTTRTISLATGRSGTGARQIAVPPGATAALVRLTVTDTVGAGFLKLYSAALTSEPATSAANWYEPNAIVGADATVAVDAQGRVKVTAGVNSTGVVIDVVGYVF